MTRDLVFEIGVEELPSGYVPPALEQLERLARDGLAEQRLAFGDLCAYGTPRRLALFVNELSRRQADRDEDAMGPAVRVAFDAEGKPTRALIGFCQGKGVDPSAVRRVQTAKGEYVAATVHHVGKPALEVLPALLASIATRLQFPKMMRWGAGDARFARPVRWLLALLGDELVPVEAFGVSAGRHTYGHRFLKPERLAVSQAGQYVSNLEKAYVLVDHRARASRIREQMNVLADEVVGAVREDEELLAINNFMVEWPTAVLGAFDRRFTPALPNEVVITALREHQRFFVVLGARGRSGDINLSHHFIVIRNGDERALENVRRGNEAVLGARLEDALFYWETDLKHPLSERVEALAGVTWIEGLGTLRDKATRLESLVGWLADRLAPGSRAHAVRAALLCKVDLISEMIGSGKEYADLQGIIGGYYADDSGEPAEVGRAIFEHYRPRGPSDALPESEAGTLLSLADKLDHVAGAFVAGKVPSGSEDPYGVRRAGNGVVRVLIDRSRHLDLRDATMEATRTFFAADPQLPQAEIVKKLGDFWRDRVATALEERGVAYDTREAALEARLVQDGAARGRPGWVDPADCLLRARALAEFRGDSRFEPLVILFKRVANILKAATETIPSTLDQARISETAERELLEALERSRQRTTTLWSRRAYGEIIPELLELEGTIHHFFDAVLVNADDAPTRLNRLRLLAEVRELFLRGWDLSRVVVEGEKAP